MIKPQEKYLVQDPILCQEKINQHLRLSDREKEIVGLLALGRNRKRIADGLRLSKKTVDIHAHHIYKKLGLKGKDLQTDLIIMAFRKGWVKACAEDSVASSS